MFLKTLKRKTLKLIKKLRVKLNYSDTVFSNNPIFPDDAHLEAVIGWLSLAQDVTGTGGVSSHFDLVTKSWGKPYRETTGYIIETFINYFHATQKTEFFERALKMADWEISVQCEDGSFGEIKKDGSVGKKIFNTGQVIIGLISIYKETKETKYLNAAEKAGNWLINNQDQDGSWKKFATQGPKTYDSRVVWPLLQLFKITNKQKYQEAAENNIDWILRQQQANYWFDNTSLSEENKPWTHLIAYTINGLIEYYLISENKDQKVFDAFYRSAKVILEIFKENNNKFLPCSFDKNWKSEDKYTCLTGDVQLGIIWMQIFELTGEQDFLEGADKIIELVKKSQIIDTKYVDIRGGIFGSSPISGDYGPFMVINWAAKFFADALLLKKKIKK